jgi:hypothetical protein
LWYTACAGVVGCVRDGERKRQMRESKDLGATRVYKFDCGRSDVLTRDPTTLGVHKTPASNTRLISNRRMAAPRHCSR